MKRRDFIKVAAAGSMAGSGLLAAPALALTAEDKVLKFVPQANLANLDPIWGTQYVVRNASMLIWDQLYGIDSTLTPKPQMAEGAVTSDDHKTWTITLRDGLKWHDGEKVTSKDCAASLKRWMVRDTMGRVTAMAGQEVREVGPARLPVLSTAAGYMVCALIRQDALGSHTLFIGEVGEVGGEPTEVLRMEDTRMHYGG